MAAESSGKPVVQSSEENTRKRKRLTAVLDKLTSQASHVERQPTHASETVVKPSSSVQQSHLVGAGEVSDSSEVSPKVHLSVATSTTSGLTRSWSSFTESCPSGDEGSISEKSPFSPSGESASSTCDVPIGESAEIQEGKSSELKKKIFTKPQSSQPLSTQPEVFRFDKDVQEKYLRRFESEEELGKVTESIATPQSGSKTPPIAEFLKELGVQSPQTSRLSPSQPPAVTMMASEVTVTNISSTIPTPTVSIDEPEEVKAKVAKDKHQYMPFSSQQSPTSLFELPRAVKASKPKSTLSVPSKCQRSSINILSPTFPVVCSCTSCSPLISITTTTKPIETHPPLWLEASAASEQFLAGGVPMSPVSPLTPSTPLSPVSSTYLDHYLHSKYWPDLYRRRSHSDGDLQQWTTASSINTIESAEQRFVTSTMTAAAAASTAAVTSTLTAAAAIATTLTTSVTRSGRPIPKPLFIPSLRKGGSLESDQSTPQDSPLDLSMKFSAVSSRGSSPRRQRRRRERRSSSISSESGPGTPFLTPSSEPSPLSKGCFELSIVSPRLSPLARSSSVSSTGEKEKSSNLLSVPVMKGDVTSPTISESIAGQYFMDVSPVVEEMPPGADVAYVCPVCGQMFSLHDRLAKHMASRHKTRLQSESSAKCYLCDVCKRSFARSDMLTRHMRLHTGLKPYTCQVCGQVFSRSDHLSTHQRTHTGEKPYRCPQCPYAACRRDMITRHMRTHTRYDAAESGSGVGQESTGSDTSGHKDISAEEEVVDVTGSVSDVSGSTRGGSGSPSSSPIQSSIPVTHD
ncbi:hypothetical protein CHUAL_011701 [Chamberlinius hualienensis]